MRLPKYFLRKHVEKKNLFLNRLHFWQFFSNGGLRVGAIALISISMDGNDFLVLERKQNPKLESPCTGKGFSVVDFAFFLLLWFSSTAITLDHFYDWAMIISTPWIWYQAVFCGNYLHYFHSFTLITCFIIFTDFVCPPVSQLSHDHMDGNKDGSGDAKTWLCPWL